MNGVTNTVFAGWVVATVVLYWLAPRRLRHPVLISSTIAVLAYVDLRALWFLIGMTALTGVASRVSARWRDSAVLGAAACVLGVVFAFKLLETMPDMLPSSAVLIPLGLSFYSFRCAHLLIEVYLERINPPDAANLIGYLFFPATIFAGPIHRYPTYVSNSTSHLDAQMVSDGLERILYGYAKIVILSNYLLSSRIMPPLFAEVAVDSAAYHYLGALEYGATLYLQFSGYSDIAIGFALMLGYRVIENFNWPFLRTDINAFWRSWHISLSSWCREYVFTSVHALTRNGTLAALATMLVIGLWHGATLNYLMWGTYHGFGIVVHQAWGRSRPRAWVRGKLPAPVHALFGWLVTSQFVILSFVWTKDSDFSAALSAYAILLGIGEAP
jgi:alginate O-acetyltransferase complex protein AlgI